MIINWRATDINILPSWQDKWSYYETVTVHPEGFCGNCKERLFSLRCQIVQTQTLVSMTAAFIVPPNKANQTTDCYTNIISYLLSLLNFAAMTAIQTTMGWTIWPGEMSSYEGVAFNNWATYKRQRGRPSHQTNPLAPADDDEMAKRTRHFERRPDEVRFRNTRNHYPSIRGHWMFKVDWYFNIFTSASRHVALDFAELIRHNTHDTDGFLVFRLSWRTLLLFPASIVNLAAHNGNLETLNEK